MWGVNTVWMTEKFGTSYAAYFTDRVKRYITDKSVENQGTVYLLTTQGKFFADRVASDLFFIQENASHAVS